MNVNQIGASAGYTFAWWSLDSTLERVLQSIERLSELGYKMYSLEILEPPLVSMYEAGNVRRLLDKGRQTGMSFSSFIPYHCVTNLASADKERRQLGIKQFTEGVEIAKQLGISLVTIASDWPPEWVAKYSSAYEHAPAEEFWVPSRQEYDRLWGDHIEALKSCLEIAEKNHLRMGYEPRANSLVANVDSFLRLWDKLSSGNFLCVLDVMHCAYHREDLPVAIKKLGSRLGIIQVCGADGKTLSHLPLTNDSATQNMLKALDETDFKGILDAELYGMPSSEIDKSYLEGREILEQQIAALNA
jgi:sugar phosphate isomerase/epimerase